MPPSAENSIFCLIGGPSEYVHLDDTCGAAAGRAYWSAILDHHERSGFDYLDFDVDPSANLSFPASYGGMSGSALWQVRRGALEAPVLIGVAFYEGPEKRFIRCHGPKSLYGRLLHGHRQ